MGIRDSSTLPLILSTSKYFRKVFQLGASFFQNPNIPDTFFGDEMHCSSLELGRKRVELNVRESFLNIFLGIIAQIFGKQYLLFQKSNFTKKGTSVKVAILSFFLNSLRDPTTQKISFH